MRNTKYEHEDNLLHYLKKKKYIRRTPDIIYNITLREINNLNIISNEYSF